MSDEWIKIAAPATTSNIGAGFDTFGLAIHEPYDIIEGRKIPSGIVISDSRSRSPRASVLVPVSGHPAHPRPEVRTSHTSSPGRSSP